MGGLHGLFARIINSMVAEVAELQDKIVALGDPQVEGLGTRLASTAPRFLWRPSSQTPTIRSFCYQGSPCTCTRALLATLPSLSLEDVAVAKQKGLQAWLAELSNLTHWE